MKLKVTFYILAVVTVLFLMAYLLFNKSHKNISTSIPDHLLSAKELVDLYLENENSANSEYLGKVLEVTGSVLSIERSGGVLSVIALKGNEQSVVRCALFPQEKATVIDYKEGTIITIKGICIGFLQDVNMRDCILLNQTEK